jgi:ATP-dependent helicase Lhr and Lhr-like helicase
MRHLVRPHEQRPRGGARDGPPGSPEFLRRLRARTGHTRAGEGRWSLVAPRSEAVTPTEWSAAMAQQLLVRNGLVMRETAIAENVPGGYPVIYPALRTMEESGWIRRGMFVSGLGAAQFAMTSAVDMLRSLKAEPEHPEVLHLAASDPANPYGALLPWPRQEGDSHGMSRASGGSVILVNGELAAFLRRRNPAIRVLLPEYEPERSHTAQQVARKLAEVATRMQAARSGLLIATIDDAPARDHALARFLEDAGFVDTSFGFQMRRSIPVVGPSRVESPEDDEPDDDGEPETA